MSHPKAHFAAGLPGIVGGILLAVSRAIGETMIVVMAAGLSANLTANPLKAVTTVTAQIVTLLVGDQEFDSPDARPSPRPFGKTELISKLVKTTTSEKAWGEDGYLNERGLIPMPDEERSTVKAAVDALTPMSMK